MKKDKVSELRSILTPIINLDNRYLTCIVLMIFALYKVKTVSLSRLAEAMDTNTKSSSNFRRLQRLLSKVQLCPIKTGFHMASLFFGNNESFYLAMDRTNWKFGKIHINVLLVGITLHKTVIPVGFTMLNKAGNSSTDERIELMKRVIKKIPPNRIKGILCDREFVGGEWFKELVKLNISYYIRVKKNVYSTTVNGNETKVENLFRDLKINQTVQLYRKRKLYDQYHYLSAFKSTDGELVMIATNKLTASPLEVYAFRWDIECFFQNIKDRGFNFEDTHIQDQNKIHNLLCIVTIASCWALYVGQEATKAGKTIKIKNHGRKANSIFRAGLDILSCLSLKCMTWKHWKKCINLLRKGLNTINKDTKKRSNAWYFGIN